MQMSSRLTIAIHMLVCMDTFKDKKVTSGFLAESVNVNPVVIRRLLSQLKAAGLVEVARGVGGAKVKRPLSEITVLDVYRAVKCVEDGELFRFHEDPDPDCPVGRNIRAVLDRKLDGVQRAMEEEMRRVTMDSIAEEIRQLIREGGERFPAAAQDPEV